METSKTAKTINNGMGQYKGPGNCSFYEYLSKNPQVQ